MDLLKAPGALRRWAIASLVANMAIIVTGGLVRVTGSGLGCPTWPQCSPGSYVPHSASDLHAMIEFGNRTLTFVLVAIAIGTLLAAWFARDAAGAPRRRVRWLAIAAALGIPAQAVIGGISVLTGLNPWVVGAHLIPSAALVMVSVVLVHEAGNVAPASIGPRPRLMVNLTFVLGCVVLLAGAVVTGAGPNSGDGGAARNGLELVSVARAHSALVWLVVGLTVVLAWLLRADERARVAVHLLLAIEIAQGAIGYLQYALALPPSLVIGHMVGTAAFSAALANMWWFTRTPRDEPVVEASGASRATA